MSQAIGATYDEATDRIWKNREVLAPLLKYSVAELKDEPVEDIMGMIDQDSIRGDAPVGDIPPAIQGDPTVMKAMTEPLFAYLESVFKRTSRKWKSTRRSAMTRNCREVEEMPGMSQVIFNQGVE